MASARATMLNSAFEALPEAIEPALSTQNHASRPVTTDFRTASGALS